MRMRLSCYTLALFLLLGAVASAALHGFDCSVRLIDRADIKQGGPPRDGIPALTNPRFEPAASARWLDDEVAVVGVRLRNSARAYPLPILAHHEVVNDVLDGLPIAVTYCPLCRSALVFDRRINGQIEEFGVSGLLYNSNVLLYNRRVRREEESLWSQGEMRAVTGPAAEAGHQLKLLPSQLTSWKNWRNEHPKTAVLTRRTGHRRNYMFNPYDGYHRTDRLMFRVDTQRRKPRGFRRKDQMILVYAADRVRAYAHRDLADVTDGDGTVLDVVGDRLVALHVTDDGTFVQAHPADDGPDLAVAHMYWFAVAALQPEAELFKPDAETYEVIR